MAPESSRKRLPFEPGKKSKGMKPDADSPPAKGPVEPAPAKANADGTISAAAAAKAKAISDKAKARSEKKAQAQQRAAATAIPEVVSQRMLRRMLAFSGVPTFLGVATFFGSYALIVKGNVDLPPYAVLLTTLGCFGLGVVGLTYGVLSASWDEERPGDWLGLDEFKVNFGRMTNAWGQNSRGS
ncbi:MAG: PAM68 family protein [Leptolyngbya sp.]|nr:PAM68 family protein [Leptolyngbya sp.]